MHNFILSPTAAARGQRLMKEAKVDRFSAERSSSRGSITYIPHLNMLILND